MPDLSPLTPANVYSNDSQRNPSAAPRPHAGGPRLVARNAATIKEAEDEEDEEVLQGSRNKKESLADMFAAEPRQSSRKSSGSSGKRTVPAVVLGSPPPRESSLPKSPPQSNSSTVRRTKRNDLTVDTTEDDVFRPRQTRSEAQELADFFSNTQPPPDPTPSNGESRSDEPPKSAKSFKSFMSRMTGRKKDGKEVGDRDRPPMPSSYSQQGLSGLVKRQKSTASFTSSALPTPNPVDAQPPSARPYLESKPSSARQYPDAPSTTATSARQTSRDTREPMTAEKMTATGVAAMTMGSGVTSSIVSPEKSEKKTNGLYIDTEPKSKSNQPSPQVDPPQVSEADVAASLREPSRPADSPTIGDTSHQSQRGSPPVMLGRVISNTPMTNTNESTGEYVVVDKSDASPPTIDTASHSASSLSPLKPTPSTTTGSQFPSEAASFRTANEGSESDTGFDQSINGTQTRDQDDDDDDEVLTHKHRRSTITAPHASASVPAQPPSIPLSDLSPLRGLLQHATTVRECQLLLSAILSQLGVPPTSGSEVVDPESRVAAWLLAGREGPVDYPFGNRTISGDSGTVTTTTGGEETIATPTLNNAGLRTEADARGAQEEQLDTDHGPQSYLGNAELRDGEIVKRDADLDRESETTSMARTSMTIDSVPEVREARAGQRVEAVTVPY